MKALFEIGEMYDNLCIAYGHNVYHKEEEWKPLIYNNEQTIYKVSNYGRIRNTETGDIPKMDINKSHYYTNIKIGDASLRAPIYRLVALAFIPIPEKYIEAGYMVDDLVVDHKRDGDVDNWDDNTIWNLQWLTHRENLSKAAKCGQRDMYPKEFRQELDDMIERGDDNSTIYEFFEKKYNMTREELKGQVQVRRRRLGKTLMEHHERSKEELAAVDRLLKQGLSNDEIIEKLNLPKEGRASSSLLQHRRAKLGIPAQTSKFLTNAQNQELNALLVQDVSYDDIIKYFGMDKLLDHESLERFRTTLRARRGQMKRRLLKEQEEVQNT